MGVDHAIDVAIETQVKPLEQRIAELEQSYAALERRFDDGLRTNDRMIRVAEVQEILGVGKSTVLALYRKKEIEGQHQGERRPLSKENRQLNYWSIQSNIALSGGVYIHGKR